MLEIEFASKARRDPWLREQLAVRSREIRGLATELLSRHAEEYGVTLPRPADELATAVLSVGVGLGLQRAIDPTVPVAAFTGSIRALGRTTAGQETRAAAELNVLQYLGSAWSKPRWFHSLTFFGLP